MTDRPLDLRLAEHLEAIAVAIAMALVLKLFVVEAYQIPTGSMQPTVLGDAEAGIQDRVLADKLCTLLRDPRAWEVMIFRLPYDERQLYVKRIVGLPGQTLEIRGGDVWIDGHIARKPDGVNDSVLKTVFPVDDGGLDIGRAFRSSGPGVEVRGRTAAFAADGAAELRLAQDVKDEYLHGYDRDWGIAGLAVPADHAVADLEVSLDVTLGAGASALRLGLLSDEGDLTVELPRTGAGAARVLFLPAGGGEPRVLLDEAGRGLPGDRTARVTVRNVDRRVVLTVNGDEWLRADDDLSVARPDQPARSLVSLAVPGGGSVSAVVLRRDIFYTRPDSGERWEIPRDSCFALGDNTQASLDSRRWNLKTYALRDGRTITGFWFPAPKRGLGPSDANPKWLPGSRVSFADTHGDVFEFAEADVVSEELAPSPFIPASHVLGKAVAVFWPVIGPFRWKLIR